MKEINCAEFQQKINKNKDLFLVDVREPFEHANGNLPGINVPTSSIQTQFSSIPKDKDVIIYCRSGARSSMVINFLEQNFGYTNLTNLTGGVNFC